VPRRTAALLVVATLVLVSAGCSSDDDGTAATTTTAPAPEATTTTTEAPLEAGEQIFVYVPRVGDCFDRRTLDTGEPVVLLLDCDLPHQAEVFHVFEATDDEVALAPGSSATSTTTPAPPDGAGETDPDAEPDTGTEGTDAGATTTTAPVGASLERALEDLARRRCPPLLGDYVGTPYELSELEVSWWHPTPEAWDEGQRTVACTLHDPTTDRLAGSQRDARR
jgi:hypothetical protein